MYSWISLRYLFYFTLFYILQKDLLSLSPFLLTTTKYIKSNFHETFKLCSSKESYLQHKGLFISH